MLCPMRPPPITNLSPARGLVRGQKEHMPTADELRVAYIAAKRIYEAAKNALALQLAEEFPAKVGDVVRDRTGIEYRIERISPHHDGPTLYLRKRTKAGWHANETNVAYITDRILLGTAVIVSTARKGASC
jgi:hypothetical protein